ncbi:MAG: malto-oligosyltrehalose synthase [Cytophagales bacterium]
MNFPCSTYRLQLNSGFPFSELKNIVPYLHKLGISTIYAAPITKAIVDSSHGYDAVDPIALNPQIGTIEELKELGILLKSLNMNWLQDIVPNHMAFENTNTWLNDVIEKGEKSSFWHYFDIDWQNGKQPKKIEVPILSKSLEESLQNGDLKLIFDIGGFSIAYFKNIYPLSVAGVLFIHDLLLETIKTDDVLIHQLKDFVDKSNSFAIKEWLQFKNEFSSSVINDRDKARKIEIDSCIERINADKKLLELVIQNQNIAFYPYQSADVEMNYRRFFTVNSLISLQMQDEKVFDHFHQFVYYLYNEKLIQGVRIDHIDGLLDPKQYLDRLRNLLGADCYIIAEKILASTEEIPKDWNLQGTTGYEFLALMNRLLTNGAGAEEITAFYHQFVPFVKPYQEIVFDNKWRFLQTKMGGELANLARLLADLLLLPANVEADRIKLALSLFMSSFSVYRIYPDQFPLSKNSLGVIDQAIAFAIEKDNGLELEMKLLRSLFEQGNDQNLAPNKLEFLKRLMQFTGPLAAKGVEDTTFYVYNPIISHNEVGDSPAELSISIDQFHEKMLLRQQNSPYSLNATATHDTKRGEDGRMRINALADVAQEWNNLVNQWHAINQPYITARNGKSMPSPNDEWFIYQSLIGSFPEDLKLTDSFIDRTKNFIIKALREANVETSYGEPNTQYEHICVLFIDCILKKNHPFLYSFIPFLAKIIPLATTYSSIQTIIKITAPGIPDLYQGSELWELSYVDPDNRRPIDFQLRTQLLDQIIEKSNANGVDIVDFIRQKREVGAEKMYVTWKMLTLRQNFQDVFLLGHYIPLSVIDQENKVIAYARTFGNKWAIVVTVIHISDVFLTRDTNEKIKITLPAQSPAVWHNIFTSDISDSIDFVLMIELSPKFPMAVFTNQIIHILAN